MSNKVQIVTCKYTRQYTNPTFITVQMAQNWIKFEHYNKNKKKVVIF